MCRLLLHCKCLQGFTGWLRGFPLNHPAYPFLTKLVLLHDFKYHLMVIIAFQPPQIWYNLLNERVAEDDFSNPHDFIGERLEK